MARHRSYRGKGRKGSILAVVCVALALAAAYGFVWLFEHLSMNADGTLTVNLPGFLSPAPSPEPPPATGPLDLVVVPPAASPTAPPEPTPEPTPAPPRALWVSQETVQSPDALAELKAAAEAAGADTLMLDHKSDEGTVLTPEDWDAARAALGPDFTYIARISLFLDNTMPRRRNALAVKHISGLNWLSPPEHRWLNPYREEAADYLLTVMENAAALGAGGILLDNLCFPWYGRLDRIAYGEHEETPRAEAIEAFCARLDGLGLLIPVSAVALRETVLNGVQEIAGQELTRMTARFDRVYTEWPDLTEPLPKGLTPILAEPPAEGWDGGWLAAP
ncbi:MAG: putative glycoside hydrolase [Oscillospiraceae bacterium]|nr:putative glycoside hydrolase [Oscillospiraceae bacterium]